MPQQTVYVRDEDLDKWKAIEKKSAWLHEHLRLEIVDLSPAASKKAFDSVPKVIKTKDDVIPAIKQVFPEAEFEPLYRDKKNKRL